MKKILLTGVTGQVGYELLQTLQEFGEVVPTVSRAETSFRGNALHLDLADPDSIVKVIREVKPALIVNPAAYTDVNKAEEEAGLAMGVNGTAPGIIAEEAKSIKAGMIHFSTDYVYPGTGSSCYTESSETGPVNTYGKSKLAGDRAVQASGIPHWIIRTSWVYGVTGNNFVKTMLKLGKKNSLLSVVDDQIGAPTSAGTLADVIGMMLRKGNNDTAELMRERGGVFHVVNQGEANWYDFALEIFRLAEAGGLKLQVKEVVPVSSDKYPTGASRPENSRLSCAKLKDLFNIQTENWKDALEESFPRLLKFL